MSKYDSIFILDEYPFQSHEIIKHFWAVCVMHMMEDIVSIYIYIYIYRWKPHNRKMSLALWLAYCDHALFFHSQSSHKAWVGHTAEHGLITNQTTLPLRHHHCPSHMNQNDEISEPRIKEHSAGFSQCLTCHLKLSQTRSACNEQWRLYMLYLMFNQSM